MTDYSFAAMTTVTASTERASLTGFVANLSGLKVTPLAPVDAETKQRLEINTPHVTWETCLQDAPDIRKGDKLVIGAVKYPIYHVEKWPWLPSADTRLRIIVEDLRNGV
jgi:hypothetical protein